jgi:hypothetical protein
MCTVMTNLQKNGLVLDYLSNRWFLWTLNAIWSIEALQENYFTAGCVLADRIVQKLHAGLPKYYARNGLTLFFRVQY